MEQHVTRDHIPVSLRSALCIDRAGDVAQIAQDVEAVHHKGQVAFQDAFRQAGVPHKVVRIHTLVFIATTAEHRYVRTDLHAPRQFDLSRQTVVEVARIDRRKVVSTTRYVHPGATELRTYFQLVDAIVGADVLSQVERLHRTTRACQGIVHAHQVHTVVICGACGSSYRQAVCLVGRKVVVHRTIGIPIAVHVFGLCGAHTRLLVIDVARGYGVLRDRVVQVDVERTLLLRVILVESQTYVVSPCVAQVGIAVSDVQRVCVVADVKQARH